MREGLYIFNYTLCFFPPLHIHKADCFLSIQVRDRLPHLKAIIQYSPDHVDHGHRDAGVLSWKEFLNFGKVRWEGRGGSGVGSALMSNMRTSYCRICLITKSNGELSAKNPDTVVHLYTRQGPRGLQR